MLGINMLSLLWREPKNPLEINMEDCLPVESDTYLRNFSQDKKPGRCEFPVPSGLSMKSDNSMWSPPEFSHERKSEGCEFPVPSGLSMKSDKSMWVPDTFRNETKPKKFEFPVPSGLSMKSDNSMWSPPEFSHERKSEGCEFPVPSGLSMKSDKSMWVPDTFRNETKPKKKKCRRTASQKLRGITHHLYPKDTEHLTRPNIGCPHIDDGPLDALEGHKTDLRRRAESVREGTAEGRRAALRRIYTELYITEGESEGVNTQHEVWQLEMPDNRNLLNDKLITCNGIFDPLPGDERPIRTVLMMGVAGIGKTFCVQKFILDWAEGLANQDTELLILLPFRELNLVKDKQYSLLRLIHTFHPTLKMVTAERLATCKVVFIFDGLDESRLPLDFLHNKVVLDVTETAPLDVLLTNLIKGNLLPSSSLWITTRPAAAHQIPPQCIERVTEVKGFTDLQKEQYFRLRFEDGELASRIITYIKSRRSIYIMCHIPVFCWITATVLEDMPISEETGDSLKTLTETEMYAHFLLVQTKRKKEKFDGRHEMNKLEILQSEREVLLKMGRLAFKHLEKGNCIFYQEDMEECGLDVKDVALYSGLATEIFQMERTFIHKMVFCFIHLSIQEFLAAVYIFHWYTRQDVKVFSEFLKDESGGKYHDNTSLGEFLGKVTNKASKSKNRHPDLFVRFIHELSLEMSKRLLGGLLGEPVSNPDMVPTPIWKIKEMCAGNDPLCQWLNCLTDLKCCLANQEIQELLQSDIGWQKELSGIHYLGLAHLAKTFQVPHHPFREGQARPMLAARLRKPGLQLAKYELLASD